MATLALVKTLGGLKAADDASAEALRRFAVGEVIRVDVKKRRNGKLHAKWWALVRLVYESSGTWPSAEVLHALVCIRIGHCDTFAVAGTDIVYQHPRTISYEAMDELAFSAFYERGVDALCELAGDIDSDALREAVLQELSR